MTVLTLAGKPIDWAKPPAATTKVKWSRKTKYGKDVIGSLRTIAHLDHLNILALRKYKVSIVVLQGPYSTSVEASQGTHDLDACLDLHIPGVEWKEQQRFFRVNGFGCWTRVPPSFGYHIHGFTLPPMSGENVSDDFKIAGFKVGKYVDGGWSTQGARVTSSQIEDYYTHRTGLSGHAHDPSWFPANIEATIFDLSAYIKRQRAATRPMGPDQIINLNSHGPLARLGGDAGQELWDTWEGNVRGRATYRVRKHLTVTITADTNKHGALPNFGAGLKRLGGKGIDLIGLRKAKGGASVKVLKKKTVDLKIDGHDAHGSKIRVILPSGRQVTYWLVTANLGRKGDADLFRRSALAVRKAFGKNAVYNFQEIDEADKPEEHPILRDVFPAEDFQSTGWSTRCPTLVGRGKLRVVDGNVYTASPGLAKVSPTRVIVETVLAPK